CRHVFVDPVPSSEALAAMYDSDASSIANSDSWMLAKDYVRAPEVVRKLFRQGRIADLWRDVPGSTDRTTAILDVGCSTGLFLRVLKDLGYRCLKGMDLSPTAADYVRGTHGIPCATCLDEIPNGTIDVVTCFAVLEHTTAPVAYLN